MAAFDHKFSADQLKAVVDYGLAHNAKAAQRAAAAGELQGLDPFTINYSYLAELVKKERERRQQPIEPKQPVETLHQLIARLMALEEREVTRVEASRAQHLDQHKVQGIARNLVTLAQALDKAPSQAKAAPQEQGKKPQGLLDRLSAMDNQSEAPEKTSKALDAEQAQALDHLANA